MLILDRGRKFCLFWMRLLGSLGFEGFDKIEGRVLSARNA